MSEPNHYPVMAFMGKFFNVIAVIFAITGVIISIVALKDGIFYGFLGGLFFGAIFWAFAKFASESTKILSDIANNIKAIRHNSDSWSK